ncbi:MAG: TauD/TfdA family dioxygenase [Proteobacteria bacterium]|nr:TauD/TfdA family dioxygenase [Pseudomonadota bacterium]
MSEWQVKRLSGSLGAEIRGPVLGQASGDEIDQIKSALVEHKVLFFPGQSISLDEHVHFGEQFGRIESHPNLKNPFTDHPGVFELAATQGGIADEWHTDITFEAQPSIMSVLHMVKCPDVGGDTMWTSLERAYAELSPPMQELCESLTALHDALPHNRPDKMAVHPVVRVHPLTGRKSLYVNEHFTRRIVEMNWSESRALLDYLTEWVKNPRFTLRYRWTTGTVAMWDNRCTQHFVLNDFEGERVIQRVTIMGDEVTGAREPKWEPFVRPGPMSATSRHDRQLALYLKAQGKGSNQPEQLTAAKGG